MSRYWSFSVIQQGIQVACGDAPDEASCRREAFHYAMMYAQDGPQVRVDIKPPRQRRAK